MKKFMLLTLLSFLESSNNNQYIQKYNDLQFKYENIVKSTDLYKLIGTENEKESNWYKKSEKIIKQLETIKKEFNELLPLIVHQKVKEQAEIIKDKITDYIKRLNENINKNNSKNIRFQEKKDTGSSFFHEYKKACEKERENRRFYEYETPFEQYQRSYEIKRQYEEKKIKKDGTFMNALVGISLFYLLVLFSYYIYEYQPNEKINNDSDKAES